MKRKIIYSKDLIVLRASTEKTKISQHLAQKIHKNGQKIPDNSQRNFFVEVKFFYPESQNSFLIRCLPRKTKLVNVNAEIEKRRRMKGTIQNLLSSRK
jgi:hypothetical protein